MERRDFFRLPIGLQGTCSVGDNADQPCQTVDLSFRGARLSTAIKGRIGAKATLTLPEIGVLSGQIIRVLEDGFAIEFDRKACAREVSAVNALMLNHRPSKKASTMVCCEGQAAGVRQTPSA